MIDGLAVVATRALALVASAQVQSDNIKAGFVINQKSNWEPVRRIQWLGFLVDSEDCKFYVPESKLTIFYIGHYYLIINFLLTGLRRLTARGLAKFVGRAVPMERALGPIV